MLLIANTIDNQFEKKEIVKFEKLWIPCELWIHIFKYIV